MSSSLSVSVSSDAPSPADSRRDQILRAARRCFARSGFHGASMSEICGEARMSPGALYRYFPSKDAIIEAITQEERIAAIACMAGLEGDGPIVDRMANVAVAYLESVRDPEVGCLAVEISSESLRNTAVGERFHAVEAEVRNAFAKTLRIAQTQGEIGSDLDLDLASTLIFALGDGLALRLQMQPDVSPASLHPYIRRTLAGLLEVPAR